MNILLLFVVSKIDQGGLTLPTADNYLNVTEHKKVLDAYLDYMTKVQEYSSIRARLSCDTLYCIENESSTGIRTRFQIGRLLGGEENTTKKQMKDVIRFETRLAQITIPPEDRRDEEKIYNLMSLNDLQQTAPFVRLTSFFYIIHYVILQLLRIQNGNFSLLQHFFRQFNIFILYHAYIISW